MSVKKLKIIDDKKAEEGYFIGDDEKTTNPFLIRDPDFEKEMANYYRSMRIQSGVPEDELDMNQQIKTKAKNANLDSFLKLKDKSRDQNQPFEKTHSKNFKFNEMNIAKQKGLINPLSGFNNSSFNNSNINNNNFNLVNANKSRIQSIDEDVENERKNNNKKNAYNGYMSFNYGYKRKK